MAKLVIVSELVGTPGDEFHPEDGVNVEALIEGGFVKRSTAKSVKIDSNPETE